DRRAELTERAGPDRSHPHGTPLTIDDAITVLLDSLDAEGLDALSPHRGHPGHLARPRPLEVHAAVNRHRGLRVESRPGAHGCSRCRERLRAAGLAADIVEAIGGTVCPPG